MRWDHNSILHNLLMSTFTSPLNLPSDIKFSDFYSKWKCIFFCLSRFTWPLNFSSDIKIFDLYSKWKCSFSVLSHFSIFEISFLESKTIFHHCFYEVPCQGIERGSFTSLPVVQDIHFSKSRHFTTILRRYT